MVKDIGLNSESAKKKLEEEQAAESNKKVKSQESQSV